MSGNRNECTNWAFMAFWAGKQQTRPARRLVNDKSLLLFPLPFCRLKTSLCQLTRTLAGSFLLSLVIDVFVCVRSVAFVLNLQ